MKKSEAKTAEKPAGVGAGPDAKSGSKEKPVGVGAKPDAKAGGVPGAKGGLAEPKGGGAEKAVKKQGFDPDAKYTFEEENERDDAIRKLQRSYRVHRARTLLRLMIRNNYVKLYDRENDMFFYKNKTTGQTYTVKPACLGRIDLDAPKQLKAPEDYDVGYMEGMPEGWFLGVFCSTFPRSGGRFKDMDPKLVKEKEALAELMPHDFICRLKPENVTMLEDPRSGEVLDTLERLGRIVTKKGFFVLYICTHVLTVVKGEPKTNPGETAYFATKETVWGTPEEIASSSVSLSALCKKLSSLPCRRKTVIINYAHAPEPKKTLFAANRMVYPPSDLLTRLADKANCAVIASCVAGVSMTDALQHTASLATNKPTVKDKAAKEKAKEGGAGAKVADAGGKEAKKEGKGGDPEGTAGPEDKDLEHADEKSQHSDHSAHTDDKEFDDEDGEGGAEGGGGQPVHEDSAEEFFRMLDGKDHSHDDQKGFMSYLRGKFESAKASANNWSRTMDQFVADWKVPPEAEIVQTPKPPKMRADWSKDLETGKFTVRLPTSSEVLDSRWRLAAWYVKRTVGPPVNFIRQQLRALKKRTMRGPCQSSTLGFPQEEMLLFGTAMVDGLRGGAHRPDKRVVSAAMLFSHIEDRMRRQCVQLYEAALAKALRLAEEAVKYANDARKYPDKEPEILLDRQAVIDTVNPADYNQNPLFFVPKNNAKAAKNPICIRCGPPAAPQRPFIVRTGTNEALLEWYCPEFDGVTPWKFQIEMANRSRVYKQWRPINYTPEIKTTRFLVRELPSGVPCRFRISAYNNGGWSRDSEESVVVIPGEELTPLQTAGRWRKLVMGGPLSILDKLKAEPFNRLENLLALKRLAALAQKSTGFTKGSVQVKAATAALTCLDTFPNDPEVVRAAINLVGWTLAGGPAKDKVRMVLEQSPFLPTITKYLERFRLDSTVLSSAAFVRQAMTVVPQPPVYVPPPDIWDEDKKGDDDDDSDATDSEEEKDKDGVAGGAEVKMKNKLDDSRTAIGSYLNFAMGRIPEQMKKAQEEAEKIAEQKRNAATADNEAKQKANVKGNGYGKGKGK